MISLSTKFRQDIIQNHVTIYPLLIIDNQFYFSTVKEVLKGSDGSLLNFEDHDLKISNIKESINIDTHSFNISNVTLTLNNFKREGVRLSDILSTRVNRLVTVYYKTQSCETLDDCVLVYTGVISRSKHDDKKLSLTLEDRTDYLIHKDVPIANLGYSKHVFNKDYINKNIPMIYGYVEKAPLIPYLESVGQFGVTRLSLIPDDIDVITQQGFDNAARGISTRGFFDNNDVPEYATFLDDIDNDGYGNPLYLYKGNYFKVLKNVINNSNFLSSDPDDADDDFTTDIVYNDDEQYIVESSGFISINRKYISSFAQNPPAMNELQAYKILRPNEIKLLVSEDDTIGDPLQSSSGPDSVIEINPNQGLLRPEAAIDCNENPSTIFNSTGEIDEFQTFCQIPNSKPTLQNLNYDLDFEGTDEVLKIANFSPYNPLKEGILYPPETSPGGEFMGHSRYNYLFQISSWCLANAHTLPVRIIQFPSGNEICTQASQKILELGYRLRADGSNEYVDPDPDHGLIADNDAGIEHYYPYDIDNAGVTYASQGIGGQIFSYFSGATDYKKCEFMHQTSLDRDFRDHYMTLCGLDPNNSYVRTYGNWGEHADSVGNSQVFPMAGDTFLEDSDAMTDDDRTDEYWGHRTLFSYHIDIAGTANLKHTFRGELEEDSEMIFPSTVAKIFCDPRENNPNNIFDIQRVYIGQYIPDSMPPISQLFENGIMWMNLFKDHNNPDIPFLFLASDFPQYKMDDLKGKSYPVEGKPKMHLNYSAFWNGVSREMDEPLSDRFQEKTFGGGWGYIRPGWYFDILNLQYNTAALKQHEIANVNRGWFIYVEDTIESGDVFSNIAGPDDYIGENYDEACKTRILKGTMIPLAHKDTDNENVNLGSNYTISSSYNTTIDTVTLVSGGNQGVEERLSLLFPFTNIDGNNAIDSSTHFYGAFKLHIPQEEGSNLTHLINEGDNFLVQAIATDAIDEASTNANALIPLPDHGINLISVSGEDLTNYTTNGKELTWDIRGETNIGGENVFSVLEPGDTSIEIESWDSPDKFSALSLNFRLEGTNQESRMQISTDIHTVGLVQYTIFENALDDKFYADVIGREDTLDGIYTGEQGSGGEGTVIENPSDIIFHIVEKELGQIDITNIESLTRARLISSDTKLGFSIEDSINSKQLIEEISNNTSLYPRFGTDGKLSFAYIDKEYSGADAIINNKDIIKISFSRTPIENIKTLINVKFKKDYAESSYTRSTGFCDGYDFYGNGENNTTVKLYRNDTIYEVAGYDYSYLGLKRDDNILEYESDYIRDYQTAIAFRNYLYMLNCNQHNIIDVTLPLKYLNLEIGDTVKFDELYNGMKLFGEDYTQEITRNGQKIYPYFMITSISKSSKDVKLKCIQLHKLTREFTAGLGSLSRKSELGVNYLELFFGVDYFTGEYGSISSSDLSDFQPPDYSHQYYALEEATEQYGTHIFLSDITVMSNIIIGDTKYLTSEQLRNADLHKTGNIDIHDLNVLETIGSYNLGITQLTSFYDIEEFSLSFYIEPSGTSEFSGYDDPEYGVFAYQPGDVNMDGVVNVSDIVMIVNHVLNFEHLTGEAYDLGNINMDALVNVVDIVATVSIILGGDG